MLEWNFILPRNNISVLMLWNLSNCTWSQNSYAIVRFWQEFIEIERCVHRKMINRSWNFLKYQFCFKQSFLLASWKPSILTCSSGKKLKIICEEQCLICFQYYLIWIKNFETKLLVQWKYEINTSTPKLLQESIILFFCSITCEKKHTKSST